MNQRTDSLKKQCTLAELAKQIKDAQKIYIFSHISPDGDGLGASAALQKAFEKAGKECWIIMEDEVPDFIKFVMTAACRYDYDKLEAPDLCLAVDCADAKRFAKRQRLFFSAAVTMNIDHHISNEYYADFNHIAGDRASACEIIFDLLKELRMPLDREIAEALYVGVVTDTGKFQYENTSASTHRMIAELYEYGIDAVHISKLLFQSDSLARKRLIAKMLDTAELVHEGRISAAHITQEMIKEVNASMGDSEGAIDEIRDIRGVEVAVLVKEIEETAVRVSLRSKEYVDVSKIAAEFGGGGHKRAAGCTMRQSVLDAKRILIEKLQGLNWNEWNNQLK